MKKLISKIGKRVSNFKFKNYKKIANRKPNFKLKNYKKDARFLNLLTTHVRLKHISVIDTLSEVRKCLCKGISFVRRISHNCKLCKRYEETSFSYPIALPLTELRLQHNFRFYATGIDNFGSLHVKNIYG